MFPQTALAHEPVLQRECSAYAYAPPFAAVPAGYVPRYHTVAHKLLDDERGAGPVTRSEYFILDSILDEARQRSNRFLLAFRGRFTINSPRTPLEP